MSHLDEGTLHALLDGELELDEVREIQLHLGTCAACSSRLQDVKQFLAEADRLVGALEVPSTGRAREHAAPHEPTRQEPVPPVTPQPIPFREPPSWEEPPVLLLPDPTEGMERRRRWMRGLRLAAMIVVVVTGGKLLSNALRPGKPELQFTERDLARAEGAPAVVSPEETTRPAAPPPPAAVAKQARPAPPHPAPPKPAPAPEPKVLADQSSADTGTDQFDTAAGFVEDTASALNDQVAAASVPESETVGGARARDDADAETRRAAAAALAELDRERLRSRANAATSALPPARRETAQTVEAPAAPRTLEQRAQIYLRIGLDEAVRQLGRPVHVIEGMSPQFIGLTQGRNVPGADNGRPVVRVVYLDPRGRMILLDQQRLRAGQAPGAASGTLRWTLGDVMLYLHGEPGPDVLAGIQRRVR